MDDRIKLVKQPDGVWTAKVDGVDRTVTVDESPVIVWRAMGLSSSVVEVTQTSSGQLIGFKLLSSGEELSAVEFTKQHSLYRSLNFGPQYTEAK